MSETDSFLQEVSEELRRDKLYRNIRKEEDSISLQRDIGNLQQWDDGLCSLTRTHARFCVLLIRKSHLLPTTISMEQHWQPSKQQSTLD